MSKLYSNETVATNLAAKLTKKSGELHEVVPVGAQWRIVKTSELQAEAAAQAAAQAAEALVAGDAPAIITGENGEPGINPAVFPGAAQDETTADEIPDFTAPAPSTPKPANDTLLSMSIPGAYESKGYVYTPVLKGVKRAAKTRWFATKILTEIEPITGGLRIVAPAKVFTSRDIDVTAAIPVNGPNLQAEAEAVLAGEQELNEVVELAEQALAVEAQAEAPTEEQTEVAVTDGEAVAA